MFNMTQPIQLAGIVHAPEVREQWDVARMSLRLFGSLATRDVNTQPLGNLLRPIRQTYIIPKTFLIVNCHLMMMIAPADIH